MSKILKFFKLGLVLFLAAMVMTITPVLAEGKQRKLVIHVDENNPDKMNLALNIAEQSTKEWKRRGDSLRIEIVAHGPGLHMLRSDTSPVKRRIGIMTIKQDNLTFSACGNTLKKQSKKMGKQVQLIPEARIVPAGVVRIMELQDLGYNYIRP